MSTRKNPSAQRRPWTPASEHAYAHNPIQRAPANCREVLLEYAQWLEEERGLCPGTIAHRVSSSRLFVAAVAKGRASVAAAFTDLEPSGVEDFFVAYCQNQHGPSARRSMQAGMRLFLRFAASRGWSTSELVQAVPSLRSYKHSHMPRGLGEQDIGRLLKSLAGDGGSARDRAIVLLLAGYGVRRGQVSALQLEDICWRGRTIMFRRHKGGKDVHHELTVAVAESLSLYLRYERPESNCRFVFLRSRPPYLRLNPRAVTMMVQTRLTNLGIENRPRGPHALRHAFASRLLRAGQPLKTIADLLGHRSLSATAVYAKVDLPRLFEITVEWPEVAS